MLAAQGSSLQDVTHLVTYKSLAGMGEEVTASMNPVRIVTDCK